MAKVTVITSGKGGVGKTSVSVNTALELAKKQYRTCLFDADLGLANVNILLNISPERTLADFLSGEASLQEVILPSGYGFDIIPASSGIEEMANLDVARLNRLVDALGQLENYDHFLIDTSSGISKNVISFCLAAEEVVTVITPESTSITDGYALLKVLSLNGYQGVVKILVNKVEDIPLSKKTYLHFKKVVTKHLSLDLTPAGAILTDASVEKAVLAQQPLLALFPESIASQCLRAMVLNLIATTAEEPGESGLKTFWTRFANNLGSKLPLTDQAVEEEDQALVDDRPPQPKQEFSSQLLHQYRPRTALVAPVPSPKQLWLYLFERYLTNTLDATELVALLRSDAGLTLRTRSFYGDIPRPSQRRQVSWEEMVADLGATRLSEWLLDSAVREIIAGPPETDQARPPLTETLWGSTYQISLLAEELARAIGLPFPEEAAMIGLLHNIGQLARHQEEPEAVTQERQRPQEPEKAARQEEALAIDPHQRTLELLKGHDFSDLCIDAVRYQDFPQQQIASAFGLTQVVFLAKQLAITEEGDGPAIMDLAESMLSLQPGQARSIVAETRDKASTAIKQLGLAENQAFEQQQNLRNNQRLLEVASDYLAIRSVFHAASSTPSRIFDNLHQAARALFSCDSLVFFSLNEAKSHLIPVARVDRQGPDRFFDSIGFSLLSAQSNVVKSFTDKTLLINERETLEALADIQLAEMLKANPLITLPLGSGDKISGVLAVALPARLVYSKEIHRLLRAFAAKAPALLSGDSRTAHPQAPRPTGIESDSSGGEEIRHDS